jgi:hypothetical protein
MTPNTRRGLKVFIVSLFGTLFLLLLVAAGWVIRLDNEIRERLAQKRFLPPVEFYSGPMRLSVGMKIPEKEIQDRLLSFSRIWCSAASGRLLTTQSRAVPRNPGI